MSMPCWKVTGVSERLTRRGWPSGYSASRAAEAFGHDGQVVADAAAGLLLGECRQTCSADAVLALWTSLAVCSPGASTTVRREV
ncbi:hypothetical protein [Streptomyces halstedii]|uniref:hypothetical protein n=1 Tax=Streptomyces halstedii TaxID=1944 RepID=UPI003680B4ED